MTADEDWQPKPVYSGLCIGGPLAGSWESHETPSFRCAEHQPFVVTDRALDIESLPITPVGQDPHLQAHRRVPLAQREYVDR